MSVILFESTLGRMLRAARGGTGVNEEIDAIPLTWSADMPEPIRQALLQRPVLNNEIQLLLAGEVRRVVLTRIGPMIGPDTLYTRALHDEVTKQILAETPALQRRVNDTIAASLKVSGAWDAYRHDSKKEAARVGLTLAFVVAGIALAPPTLGVSLAITIISTVRGLTDVIKKFAETYRSAEESRERVVSEIRKLREIYEDSPAKGRAMQLGGAVAHALTVGKMASLYKRDWVPGFTRIKTELNAYKGKVGHLGDHSERLARKLYDLLEQIDAFDERHGAGAPFRPELAKLRDKVAALIEFGVPGLRHGFLGTFTISEAWQKCQREMAQISAVETLFKDLKALEQREKAVLIADRALTLLTNTGVGLAGYNAALALPIPHGMAEAQEALRLTRDHQVSQGGVAAFILGIKRQFMSVFKDAHALAKELGLVTPASSDISAETEKVRVEVNGEIAPPPAPRLPAATLAEVTRPRPAPQRPQPPTRPLPPLPNEAWRNRPLPPIPTNSR